MSAGKGLPGVINYGLANSTMDRICETRRKNGFPGLAIQWGVIGDTGMVVEEMGPDQIVAGFQPQKMTSCLNSLDLLMQQSHPIVAAYIHGFRDRSSDQHNNEVKDVTYLIGSILGVENIMSHPNETTLEELGMDSLSVVQVKQILDKYSKIGHNLLDVLKLTVGNLREITR